MNTASQDNIASLTLVDGNSPLVNPNSYSGRPLLRLILGKESLDMKWPQSDTLPTLTEYSTARTSIDHSIDFLGRQHLTRSCLMAQSLPDRLARHFNLKSTIRPTADYSPYLQDY